MKNALQNLVKSNPLQASPAPKLPSTEESLTGNGLHCVLAVVPQVRRELPGIRLLTEAWLLARLPGHSMSTFGN